MIGYQEVRVISQKFSKEFAHLTKSAGGILGVGVGIREKNDKMGIVVDIESSKEVFDALPEQYKEIPVYKKIVGKMVDPVEI